LLTEYPSVSLYNHGNFGILSNSTCEFRKGSGVYVRAQNDESIENEIALDQLIARFFRNPREEGYSLAEIQDGIQRSLSVQRPDHFVLLEPDTELRESLVAEIAAATEVKVKGVGPGEVDGAMTGAVPPARPIQATAGASPSF
jgi:hypothetical protein